MRGRSWIPYAAIAVLAAGLHLRTVAFDFVFDDLHLIVHNTFLKEPWSPLRAFAHHFWYGTGYGTGYYRPIVVASLALNGRCLGWGPAGFHLINVLLHAANACLMLALARRLPLPAWACALAAALFAVHPVAAWPVASIVARVDLLPALFVLLAWWSYASLRAHASSSSRQTLRRAALTGFFFLLALLCKESAIAFLAIPIMGLRRMRVHPAEAEGSDGTRGAGFGLAAALLALLVYVGMRTSLGIGLTMEINPVTNPIPYLPFPGRIYAALRLCGRYLLYLLAPVRFGDPVGYAQGWQSSSPGDAGVVLSALLLLAWMAGTLFLWWRRERISIPLAFAVGSFLPASNLFLPIGSLYALNFLYMPLIGLCLTAGELLGRLSPTDATAPSSYGRPPRMVPWAITPILILMAIGSVLEASIWRDGVSLLSVWTRRFPKYSMAYGSLGAMLLMEGRTREGIGELRRALELDERNVDAHTNLGAALVSSSSGKETLEDALTHTRRAIELSPKVAQAHANASKILVLLGRPGDAEAESRQALLLTPGNLEERRNLAELLFKQERYREAAAEFRTLADLDPRDPDLRSPYVVSLLKAGDLEEARKQAMAARRDFPNLAWFDFCLARVEARSAHRAEALALLRNALARDQATRDWIGKVTDFDPYRGSSDFDELMTGDPGGIKR